MESSEIRRFPVPSSARPNLKFGGHLDNAVVQLSNSRQQQYFGEFSLYFNSAGLPLGTTAFRKLHLGHHLDLGWLPTLQPLAMITMLPFASLSLFLLNHIRIA
jgi:hypothetical protein